MTSNSRDNLEALLRRVEAGELDSLTPEQIDALETFLNESPAAADRLANVRPAPESTSALSAFPDAPGFGQASIPSPDKAEWDRVWNNIEAAEAAPRMAAPVETCNRSVGGRLLKLWPLFMAAAACFAIMLTWHFAAVPASAEWEIRLADQVEVEELNVYGDAIAFVDFNNDGTAMIWVFEESGT